MIRTISAGDKCIYLELTEKLAVYNRSMHHEKCRNDDFNQVIDAIRLKAEKTFAEHDENTIILIADLNNKPAGYALGRIYQEDETADNGTGTMALFDELFVDETARGNNLGYMLTAEMLNRFEIRGIKRVKLHAYNWNKAAQKLYRKFGFCEYAVSMEKFL